MKFSEQMYKPTQINTFNEFVQQADYSLLDTLSPDPEATESGDDHHPREIRSGHYVPVLPTPIPEPECVAFSSSFFDELGINHSLADDEEFRRLFSGDITVAKEPMRPFGWATGYALSIYGTEYTQQCPFRTGNAYGDGRAISVFEGRFEGRRWEMQLKGGGPTPYCRGADGRAVLRSSVREFLAQEFMHALGIPTSRSLTLYTSHSERVRRPWYSQDSRSFDPDILVENPAAISTRVAPSFIRVGQIELFARRARNREHTEALNELHLIVEHLIERNYRTEINPSLSFKDQVLELADLFKTRLTSLVTHWLRVGYCQGNFNSDNCAAGGYTLDYGPFGFCELFHPRFQPWTGGGDHFSFFNQPAAAEINFQMFLKSLLPLFEGDEDRLNSLKRIGDRFAEEMKYRLERMWASKLGLKSSDPELLSELFQLMLLSKVDYTMFFRELSRLPDQVNDLHQSFYEPSSELLDEQWKRWISKWRERIADCGDPVEVSSSMKLYNPSVAWREWLIAPAYEHAAQGDYGLVHTLQEVFTGPYDELSPDLAAQYNRLRPKEYFQAGGISHYSCSS